MGHSEYDPASRERRPWNAGSKLGAKRPLKPQQVWAIRFCYLGVARTHSASLKALRSNGGAGFCVSAARSRPIRQPCGHGCRSVEWRCCSISDIPCADLPSCKGRHAATAGSQGSKDATGSHPSRAVSCAANALKLARALALRSRNKAQASAPPTSFQALIPP